MNGFAYLVRVKDFNYDSRDQAVIYAINKVREVISLEISLHPDKATELEATKEIKKIEVYEYDN